MQAYEPALILVVSPDNEHRATLMDILAGQGYRMAMVPGIDQANSRIEDALPDLIICQPGADGNIERLEEFVSRLSGDDRTEWTPLLLMCEKSERIEFATRIHAAADIMQLPVNREELLARVRLLLLLKTRNAEVDQLHNRLRNSQKAETLSMLASGVAHELNNLMFSVLGFAEIALAEETPDLASLKESAEVSRQVAKRASEVASNLLAFSRQASGARAVADFNAVVNDAVRLMRRNLERAGIQVKLSLGPLPPTMLSIGLMQQVFVNLFINTWEAMTGRPGPKEISITTSSEDDTRIVATIADNGPGIPEDVMDKIFDPFFSTRQSPVESRAGGAGLGLYVVRQVVRDHDGIVKVESEPNAGTRFTIVIPVTMEDEARQPVTEALDAGGKPQSFSVLIVDDEESNRRVLSRLLLKSGHVAFSAANMPEAMSYIWGHKLDLIIMDLIMPNMDGVSAIGHLREDEIQIPILICTGNADAETMEAGLKAGANGALKKPFSNAEFLAELQRCVAEGRRQSIQQHIP